MRLSPFNNLGLIVTIIGVIYMIGVYQLPDTIDKLVPMSIAFFIIAFGVVAWDVLAGINIIEQKLKELEERTTLQEGD